MKRVQFRIDRAGGAKILKNNSRLQNMQDNAASNLLATIEAQFHAEFGVFGSFEITEFTTDRSSVKVSAADPATGRVLKANPRWLDQFVQDMKI